MKLEDMQPSEDTITIPPAKTGIKVKNHMNFEMKEKGCLVELVLVFLQISKMKTWNHHLVYLIQHTVSDLF